ncbi:MAG: protein of unknown function DUF763 [Candidatus Parvarchaeum acidophilus ARMAN-5]|jgi:hypothetical protein|uniref:DUF763 domain-containing protein n=1 Tax=Candidatus Parvarchaeum acidophilus ARMAN-5 TaxID=662762 RepID=D6GUU7_PARA5|nr:MAG: protein of unknown function DUF763 [Candidatus Parvarchaeum acidophilus ARMAN-5]
MVGIADLPLHYGHVPDYLLRIMKDMCDSIVHTMIYEFGEDKLLERLSNPLWFQALNNAIGMDWDSSGSTTVLLALLKQILNKKSDIFVLGGKGKHSLGVQEESGSIPASFDIDPKDVKDNSVLSAKVDTVLLQDGYNLYIHYMLVSKSGKWLVVQQGMNPNTRFARRYHLSEVDNFECEPNSSISGVIGRAVNIIQKDSSDVRKLFLELINSDRNTLLRDYSKAMNNLKGNTTLELTESNASIYGFDRVKKLNYYKPVNIHLLKRNLEKIKADSLSSISDTLLNGMTASTARAIFLISDLIYNEPPSFQDPVNYPYDPFKYSFLIGGKDGIPYPINSKMAYSVIDTMKGIVMKTKLGEKSKNRAIFRLESLTKH